MGTYLVIGSSSGIGSHIASALQRSGNQVVAINRRIVSDADVSLTADVTVDPLPVIEEALDGLVYCPGSITLKPFRSLRPDDILRDMNVNALGTVRVLQQYYANLRRGQSPSVVLFSSVAAGTGMPYHASIAMAKGAVEALTRTLAAEWAPDVRVNCIAPSLTDTPLAARLLDSDSKRASAAERHPLKTIGDSADVAGLALSLLSSSTRFVTGQVWHMDGGISSIRT